jgi:hypothetical protein
MGAKTDGHDDACGTLNVYIKVVPGVCTEIESRVETKIGTSY